MISVQIVTLLAAVIVPLLVIGTMEVVDSLMDVPSILYTTSSGREIPITATSLVQGAAFVLLLERTMRVLLVGAKPGDREAAASVTPLGTCLEENELHEGTPALPAEGDELECDH